VAKATPTPARGRLTAAPRPTSPAAIAGLGAATGLLYLLVHLIQGALLSPTPGVRFARPRLWNDPADSGELFLLMADYTLATLGLLLLYDRLLQWSRAGGWSRYSIGLALGMPVLLYVGLWQGLPYFSMDLLSYASFGYVGGLPGGNPYWQESSTILTSTFGQQLVALGWQEGPLTPYGPIWTALSTAAVRLGGDAIASVWTIKGIVVACTLGTAATGWWLLGAVDPRARMTATLAVIWNPALAILLGSEGHIDGLMLFLSVLSLALTVRQFVIGGCLVQVAAALTKYATIVLLPLQIAYWWRTRANRRLLVLQVIVAAVLGACLAGVVYAPYWIGLNVFLGTGALGSGEPIAHRFDMLATLMLLGKFVLVAVAIAIGMWYASTPVRLIEASAGVALVVLVVAPQRFYPWYMCLPLGLMALVPGPRWRWFMLAVSGCVLLASPLEALPLGGAGPIGFDFQLAVFRGLRLVPLVALVGTLLASRGSNQQPIDRCLNETGAEVKAARSVGLEANLEAAGAFAGEPIKAVGQQHAAETASMEFVFDAHRFEESDQRRGVEPEQRVAGDPAVGVFDR
jgi:hypothetical protein